MMLSVRVKSETDWVVLNVSCAEVDAAKAMRADRDTQYGNRYAVSPTDARWVGDLGEIALNRWLGEQGLENLQWITQDSAGRPDFVTGQGVRIGAKTIKRSVSPLLHYGAQVTACHADEPVDWFFFMSYIVKEQKLWLLGAMESSRFARESRRFGAGDQVQPAYRIREGHEIKDVLLNQLMPVKHWLTCIGAEHAAPETKFTEPRLLPAQKTVIAARCPRIRFRLPAGSAQAGTYSGPGYGLRPGC